MFSMCKRLQSNNIKNKCNLLNKCDCGMFQINEELLEATNTRRSSNCHTERTLENICRGRCCLMPHGTFVSGNRGLHVVGTSRSYRRLRVLSV